jgi:hypothetical protein
VILPAEVEYDLAGGPLSVIEERIRADLEGIASATIQQRANTCPAANGINDVVFSIPSSEPSSAVAE